MTIDLKGGFVTEDPRLDRVPEQDLRSLNFLVIETPRLAGVVRRPQSYTHSLNQWFDQGNEGACVGFGYAHDLAARPVRVAGVTAEYARQALYWAVQRDDPWPGGSYPGADPTYEGTSVLTGAKVLKDLGYYKSYSWALDAREVAEGVRYTGPVIFGLDWYQGMFNPDEDGFLRPTGKIMGGHCILGIGVKIIWKQWVNSITSATWDNVDFDKSYIVVHNSWGQDWGFNGRAKISLSNLDILLRGGGEACFPQRNPTIRTVLGHT